MVILKRLYSDTELIDPVVFKEGINIVLGRYSSSTNKEINGIGKSTLVRLIDYCLLSRKAKNDYFNPSRYPFLEGHSIILRFEINGIDFEIKRFFSESNKILFGEEGNLQEYSESELKEILGSEFFKSYNPTYYEPTWFRKLIKFFIKDDINHHERKIPYNFVSPYERKNLLIVYNFYLLGLPNHNLYQLEEYDREISKLKEIKKKIVSSVESEFGKKIDELRGELLELEEKVKDFQKVLEEFNFAKTFEDLENELVKITTRISKLLPRIQELKRKLEYIQESYQIEIEVDIEETARYYEKLQRELGRFIRRSLEDIINFRKSLAENRKKYLSRKEKELKEELNRLWKEYYQLENKRQKIYKILDSKGEFSAIKTMYERLLEEATKYQRLKEAVQKIEEIEEEIREKERNVEAFYYRVVEDYANHREKIDKLNLSFRDITRKCTATSEGSYLLIELGDDRHHPINIKVDIPKSFSHGRNQLKILLYDLCIFKELIENNRPVPFFLIHDGVFHGIDTKTKIRTLNFINDLLSHQAQYIVTFNEDEISEEFDGEKLNFNIHDNVITIYEDEPSKMIFKREF